MFILLIAHALKVTLEVTIEIQSGCSSFSFPSPSFQFVSFFLIGAVIAIYILAITKKVQKFSSKLFIFFK
jgi:hypothetical protein